MATLSTREQWLLAFLPSVLLALFAGGWWLRPAMRETAALRQRIQNTPSPDTRTAQIQSLHREMESVRQEIEALRTSPSGHPPNFDRNASLQLISSLCARHEIELHGAALEPGRVIPESLKTSAKGTEAAPPQVWRIDAAATYGAMRRLLDDVSSTPVLIVPLSLSMTAAEKPGQPAQWVLMLWI